MSRLSATRRQQAQRHAAARLRPVRRGISAWGSLKQELLPDIEFPVITVIAPFPGAGSPRCRRPGRQADRAGHLGRAAPGDRPVDVGELDRPRRRPVRVRDERQGRDGGGQRGRSPRPGCPQTVDAERLGAQHQRLPGHHRVDRGHHPGRASSRPRTSPAPRSCRSSWPSRASSSADVTGGLEQRLVVTLDPAKLAANGVSAQQVVGVLQANNLTFPSGQLVDDGTKIPVSTIGTLTTADQIAGLVVGYRSRSRPAAPAADPAHRPPRPPPPTPDHDRRPRDGRHRRRSRRPATAGRTATRR